MLNINTKLNTKYLRTDELTQLGLLIYVQYINPHNTH